MTQPGLNPSELPGRPSANRESLLNQGGLPVGTYGTYAEAQRAVDYLSDHEFPVENLTIVGTGLRQVERVTGRLTRNRVIIAGAVAGAWWGLFVGLLIGLFSTTGTAWITSILVAVAIGTVFGLLTALAGYRATGGERDFTSTTGLVAESYQVLCVAKFAEEARSHLARLSLSN
jgi:hypothetical protein